VRETAGIRALALAPLLGVLLAGCGAGPGVPTLGTAPATVSAPLAPPRRPAAPPPPLCRADRAVPLGRIDDPAVDELSGLTRSRRDPSILFANEDSGSGSVLTAVRTDGTVLGHVTITGAAAVDWEDLAAGPGPDGAPALFVGDIGDNDAVRDRVQVYRVPEPAPDAGATAPATRLDLRYPDGAHDAEALLVDPLRHELAIVIKRLGGGRAYTAPASVTEGPGGAVTTLRRGPAVDLGWVTAGDVSGDGRIVALRTYTRLAVWQRRGREPLARTLARRPTCTAPADLGAEGQGEALALDRRGATAITAPEGARPLLRRYGG
jgi:hypothetical protein